MQASGILPLEKHPGWTAVVTGSTSGIGRAIAETLAARGASVVVHGRRRDAAEAVVKAIQAAGGDATFILGDLANAAAREQLVEQSWKWRNGVQAWINNAGVDVLTGGARHWSFEQKLSKLWEVDVTATIHLARLIGEKMGHQATNALPALTVPASIINIGWDQAEHGMAGDSGEMFAAIKGAVMAFTKSLARSLAPHVRVNCVAPGWIKTSWGDEASDYWQSRAINESLLARWGTPQDVADAVAYLAAPTTSFITGQTLPVNGGLRQRE